MAQKKRSLSKRATFCIFAGSKRRVVEKLFTSIMVPPGRSPARPPDEPSSMNDKTTSSPEKKCANYPAGDTVCSGGCIAGVRAHAPRSARAAQAAHPRFEVADRRVAAGEVRQAIA